MKFIPGFFSDHLIRLAGFAGLGNVYEGETKTGSNFGLSSIIYEFDLGFRFYIPGTFRDTNIFKPKDKK